MNFKLIISAAAAALLTAVALTPTKAAAQLRLTPYLGSTVGFGVNSTQIPVQTSPPTSTTYSDGDGGILVAANLGLRIGRHVAADAGIRSSLGIGRPFHALTVGPRIEIAPIHVRAGFGRLRGSEELACPAGQPDCPGSTSEWVGGFDVEVGAVFPYRRIALGPAAWWSQSTSGSRRYRSLGAGVAVRLP